MAKAKETKYIVGENGYLLKNGKVYQTGEEISLTADELKNVEDKVVKAETDEGKEIQQAHQEEEKQEDKKDDKKK